MDKLEWSRLEYDEKDRDPDWFWALGIIVITSTLAAIIYGNYFFAGLLAISGVLLAIFAVKKPETIYYELNEKGLKIGSRFYPFDNIHAFYVQTDPKPILFIKTERVFMPEIAVRIEGSDASIIQDIFLSKNVPEVEMREHISEKIMESLGF